MTMRKKWPTSEATRQTTFVAKAVLKRDAFSETVLGHAAEQPDEKLVLRRLDELPWWSRPLARLLARREALALHAVAGVEGVPRLIRAEDAGVLRSWIDGAMLQNANPDDPTWYADAHRILRELRRRGVAHNDAAKPQNWLVTTSGRAALIDFQLAKVHQRKSWRLRVAAYEDLRHLLKQKRRYAPHLLTHTEKRILARRSLPSRIWRATGKRLYVLITRRLMNWSDGEGINHVLAEKGASIEGALKDLDGVRDAAIVLYPKPSKGVGLYAFVECDGDAGTIQSSLPSDRRPEIVQTVTALPRLPGGSIRREMLQLVATNRVSELEDLVRSDPDLAALTQQIVRDRKNFTDRNLVNQQ